MRLTATLPSRIVHTIYALVVLTSAQRLVAAHAEETAKPFIVRVGAQFPVNSNEASTHATLGLAYEFSRPDARWTYGVYGEYFFSSTKTVSLPYGDFDYTTPVKSYGFEAGLSARYRLHPGRNMTPYFGLGLGFYNETLKTSAPTIYATDFYNPSPRTLDNGPVGKISAGAEFRSGFLVEAVLQIFSDNADFSTGTKWGGLGANVGYRF